MSSLGTSSTFGAGNCSLMKKRLRLYAETLFYAIFIDAGNCSLMKKRLRPDASECQAGARPLGRKLFADEEAIETHFRSP